MIRVAFTLLGGGSWTGGEHYLNNLLSAIVSYQSNRLQPVLFLGEDVAPGDAEPFANMQGLVVIRSSALNKARRKWSLLQAMVAGRDYAIRRLLRDQNIDLVFEAAQFFGWRAGIPAIAWIPDFQHKVLPHLFSRRAWWRREIGFRMQVVSGRFIMLSSDDARRACEHYYPSTLGRARTVHFATPICCQITAREARAVADSYALPQRFVYLPNQFWQHKNHRLVLEALTLLRERGEEVAIAASGKQADPRNPSYFPELLAEVKRRKLDGRFRVLGLIPYSDVLALLRASAAMLNPSKFEGWSTTVEEAKAMGTPMVLSDIEVHREQAGEQAVYFDRGSAHSLAEALMSLPEVTVEDREKTVERARLDNQRRLENFALDFADLVETCVQGVAT